MMYFCSERRMMIMWSLCLIFCLSNSILVIASPAQHLCLPDQRDALWEFKNEFSVNEMKSYTETKKWRNNTDCCSWEGVSCDNKTGNVVELDLFLTNLNGPLRSNSSLFKLQHLHTLYFLSSNFSGILPNSIGNLKYLRELSLVDCNLFGKIPSSLGNLTYLTHLDLSYNDFTGELPGSIGNLNKLTVLNLQSNKLSGNFPHVLLNLSSLTWIELGSNQFKGMLPSNMSILSKLESFIINENSFSGTIPSSLFMIPSLIRLDLRRNDFSGPLEIDNISSQSKLEKFYIGENNFSGPISISDLQFVNIAQNSFSGDLTMLPDTIQIFIGSDNQFSGEIPRRICELKTLQVLDLSNNSFSGSLPRCSEIFNTSLWVLHLRNNNLSGVFPEEFINVKLTSLDVGGNRLSGKLPKSLINCTDLRFLNVEDNRIIDTFPSWLSSLPDIEMLVLRSNEFHGPILSSSGDSLSFPKLRIFEISENRFSGVLPSDYFAGWSAMSSVVATTIMPFFDVSGLSQESYHKSVFLTNKGLKMELVGSSFNIYKTIDISGNRFEGDIPESISLLKELIVLNMSNNAFTGHIPPSLSNLSNLQSLDLSENRLSGRIPTELGKLTLLEVMNFSCNRLEGPIPQFTQIQTQNSSSFAENPGLCGTPLQKKCGGEEEATTTQEEDEDEGKEEKDQVLSWIAAAIGYVPGVVCGLTIAHIFTS